MNNKRRKEIAKAVSSLESALIIVSDVASEETDSLDNIPENLEGSDMYEKIYNAVSSLEDAEEKINGAIEDLIDASE